MSQKKFIILKEKYCILKEENQVLKEENQVLKEENQKYLLKEEIYKVKFEEQENFIKNTNSFKEEFSNLSHRTLSEQTNSFLDRLNFFFEKIDNKQMENKKEFSSLVEPILQSIHRTTSLEEERISSQKILNTSINNMNTMCIALKDQVNLLNSGIKVAGKWGEIQLKRLLEISGLIKHCDFLEQPSLDTEGIIIRPDIIVNLPEETYITIDAKTPISSYIKYQNSREEIEQKKYRKDYYKSIKNHINSLGSKKYWCQFTTSPTMVIMFLPGEDFWRCALEEDGDIIEYAYNMNVVVTTPLTLIPLLRIIALLWSRYKISQDSEDLKNKSKYIYEQMLQLNTMCNTLKKHLDGVNTTYNKINYSQKIGEDTLKDFREKYFPQLPRIIIK